MTTIVENPYSGLGQNDDLVALSSTLATSLAVDKFQALQIDVRQHAATLESSRVPISEHQLTKWYDELEVGVNGLTSAFWEASQVADLDNGNDVFLRAFIPSGASVSRHRQLQPLVDDYGVDVTGMSMRAGHQLTIPTQQITAAHVLSQGNKDTLKADPILNLRVRTSSDKPNQVMSPEMPGKIVEQPSSGHWYNFLLRVSDVSLKRVPVQLQAQVGR